MSDDYAYHLFTHGIFLDRRGHVVSSYTWLCDVALSDCAHNFPFRRAIPGSARVSGRPRGKRGVKL